MLRLNKNKSRPEELESYILLPFNEDDFNEDIDYGSFSIGPPTIPPGSPLVKQSDFLQSMQIEKDDSMIKREQTTMVAIRSEEILRLTSEPIPLPALTSSEKNKINKVIPDKFSVTVSFSPKSVAEQKKKEKLVAKNITFFHKSKESLIPETVSEQGISLTRHQP